MSVPDSADAEWNEWYNTEYIPGYLTVPGVIYARRYQAVDGERSFATVYELMNDKVSESADWSHQREHSSPRSGRMRALMTMAAGSPGVYQRILSAIEPLGIGTEAVESCHESHQPISSPR